MAGDKSQKTEKPTEKRKREARKEGQVVRSPDFVPWLSVLIATFIVPGYMARARDILTNRLASVSNVSGVADTGAALVELRASIGDLLALTVPLILSAAALAIAMSLAQTGFVLSLKSLRPKAERLNPIAGIKRLVSPRGQWEAMKAALRMVAVAAVAWPMVAGVSRGISGKSALPLDVSLAFLGSRLIQLTRIVAVLGLVISAVDYAVQRRNHERDLKMSKEDIRQETKQSDGDPTVKSRMRQAAQSMSRNRMLSAAGDATAIVVNPTHFAVALRYDDVYGVPVVVAKGRGEAALRIRRQGLDRSIAVIECKPLARALYRVCDVGTPIPRELFQGVAVLLAFVQRLGPRRSLGGVPVMPDDESALGLGDLRVEASA